MKAFHEIGEGSGAYDALCDWSHGRWGKSAGEDHLKFREAMTAPALLPEFQGNIFAVPMSPFWDEPLAAIQPRNGNRSSTFHRQDATPRSRRLERQVEA